MPSTSVSYTHLDVYKRQLNQFLARSLVQRARVAATLGEWRGAPPIDMAALEHVLLRVSEMVCELPQLREMDINPIICLLYTSTFHGQALPQFAFFPRIHRGLCRPMG